MVGEQARLDVDVVENPDRSRFEAYVDGELAGIVNYVPLRGKVIATHAETFDAYRGKGVAARMVAGMLDRLRADGRLVVPQCPYVTAYLQKHPEYADIVDTSARS